MTALHALAEEGDPGITLSMSTGIADVHAWAVGGKSLVKWLGDYLSPWWPDTGVGVGAASNTPKAVARVNVAEYDDLREWVCADPTPVESFIRAPALRRIVGNRLVAVSGKRRVAYLRDLTSSDVEVVGTEACNVNLDVSRLVRLMVTDVLESLGWTVMHAGCVVNSAGQAALILGHKGAGKTTTSLTMAQDARYSLLANDRCLVRSTGAGIRAVPWPGAISIGFGLLAALGWAPTVSAKIVSGAAQHPYQHPDVVDYLANVDYSPRFGGDGRELKFELMPRDLAEWFGIATAASAIVETVIFPTVTSEKEIVGRPATVTATTFVEHVLAGPGSGYPNFLQFEEPVAPLERLETQSLLEELPELVCHAAALGPDVVKNAEALIAMGLI